MGAAAKRAKSDPAYRVIALPDIAFRSRFIEYVEARRRASADWVFETRGGDAERRTAYVSRLANKMLAASGIDDEAKVFHSFRHTVKRKLCGQVADSVLDQVTGHAPKTVGDGYGGQLEVAQLKAALETLQFPKVNWAPVLAAGQARAARLA